MIVAINSVPYGSTCNVMLGVLENVSKKQDVLAVTGFSKHPIDFPVSYKQIGGFIDKGTHMLLANITGFDGCFSFIQTKKLLRELDELKPDLIHIHNLHGWFINIPMLFSYIKKKNLSVVWTLHDCWSFTGHCPHFTLLKCDKWKTGCYNCLQYKEYPQSFWDNAKMMYKLKKKWFTGVENMTIVTPSQWLADLVKESFLNQYAIEVINNGIDLNVFKPTYSDFKEKYGISKETHIVLGVSFVWGERKGLDVFVKLSETLDQEKYKIVLVGTDNVIDKQLPNNIISIHRTQNQQELAKIYTAADVFVNPTREENYPTVNMEAIACGTPVLTFRTGGSPEMLSEQTGSIVNCDDINKMKQEIIRICERAPYKKVECVKWAEQFDVNRCFKNYVDLYKRIIGENI